MGLNVGKGWRGESVRHSNARKYGSAGGTYSKGKGYSSKIKLTPKEKIRVEERKAEMQAIIDDLEMELTKVKGLKKQIGTKEDIEDVRRFQKPKTTVVNKKNLTDNIIAYENGELSDKQTLQLFSYLIETGRAWTLQGHYGRTARNMIQSGFIGETGKINWTEYDKALDRIM